jgi:hypothetical protein
LLGNLATVWPEMVNSNGVDLIMEMQRDDVLPEADSAALGRRLAVAIGRGASVKIGVSQLETHGLPWWLAIHLWCMSSRAMEHVAELSETTCDWATEWRRSCPRQRPVYITLREASGRRLSGVVVGNRGVRRLALVHSQARPKPEIVANITLDSDC